jgi:pyrimidine oxygenase
MLRRSPNGSTTRPAPTSRRRRGATARRKDDPSTDPYGSANRRRTLGVDKLPTNQGVFVGSYATVAGMLDELAAVPGVRGVMLTFDDFIIGKEQFGTRIPPLMRCRGGVRRAA